LPIITALRAEDRREILLCLHRPLNATGPVAISIPRTWRQ
jgi:hypothetical protein